MGIGRERRSALAGAEAGGELRLRSVTAKLALNVSVIVVGALVIGPTTTALLDGRDGSQALLIVASAYDVVALTLATSLSVYKPGHARDRRRMTPATSVP